MDENGINSKSSNLRETELKTANEHAPASTDPLLTPTDSLINNANYLQLNKKVPDSIDGQLLSVPNPPGWNRIENMEVAIASPSDLTLCGIGAYRPSWLQRFSTKKWMLFWLCWFCFVQGMLVNGFVPSILSTIERRFVFSSAILGRIMQFYDIGYVICCIPVSYFGGRHSKPLFLASGILIMGIGSFLFSMPHMVSDKYEYIDKAEDLGSCSRPNETMVSPANSLYGSAVCNETDVVAAAATASSNRFFYEVLFCLAHLLHGIGATPLFTLGVSYIDENVKPALSSMYIGVFYTFVILGPAAGFVFSSLFLRYHTDYFNMERPTE